MQAVFGGQPLLIVGVAEPIVLTYAYMYRFARDKPDLGEQWLHVFHSCLIMSEPLAAV